MAHLKKISSMKFKTECSLPKLIKTTGQGSAREPVALTRLARSQLIRVQIDSYFFRPKPVRSSLRLKIQSYSYFVLELFCGFEFIEAESSRYLPIASLAN